MSTDVIAESGMLFGPYPEGHCFHVEHSGLYRRIRQGVRMAEMALLREPSTGPCTVWFIEAKSSTPRPETQPGFTEFVEATREKLTNALTLTVAACLGRHETSTAELPVPFKKIDLARTGFRLVLIVNGHQDDWCVPLQDALRQSLLATVKTWALKPTAVAVINDAKAIEWGVISGKVPP
jgi:hypothetical protein